MPRKKKRHPLALDIPRHPWVGTPMLDEVRQLNARCFAQLVEAVKAHPDPAGTPALQVLFEHASQIDARVCERAGSCPVLLLDLDFGLPERWDRATVAMHSSLPLGLFTRNAASPLLHEILMQAWSLAHAAPRSTRLFFGMAPEVTEAIARLTGEDLERVAQERAAYLRPRWEDRRTFWARLLDAAVGTNDAALVDVHLHCLSLLGGELLPVRRVG
jgi:hypothetical protein